MTSRQAVLIFVRLVLCFVISSSVSVTFAQPPATEAPPAAADSASPPAAAEDPITRHDEAARLFREGFAALRAEQLERAEQLFTRSLALHPAPDTASNLATVQFRRGKYAAAATHFHLALKNLPAGTDPTKTRAVRDRLGEAKSRVFTLALRVNAACTATLGATSVALDANEEHLIFIAPGTLVLTVEAVGYTRHEETLDGQPGVETSRTLRLTPTGDETGTAAGWYWPVVGTGIGLTVASAAVAVALIVVANGEAGDVAQLQDDILVGDAFGCTRASTSARCGDLSEAADSWAAMENAAIGMSIAAGGMAVATIVVAVVGATLGSESQTSEPQAESAWQLTPFVFTGSTEMGGGAVLQAEF